MDESKKLREISRHDWDRIEMWRRGLIQKNGTAVLAVSGKWIRFETVRVVPRTLKEDT